MTFRPLLTAAIPLLVSAAVCSAQPAPKMSKETRFNVIRALTAEMVTVRKPFPMGKEGLSISPEGKVEPDDGMLNRMVLNNGPAAKPGERARITNVEFKGDKIIFEINGGPEKKKKWYQRLSVGGAGGTAPISPSSDEIPKGSFVALEFKKHVSELTVDQIKERLAPVFDFRFKSPLEAYMDTIPPKAREAIKNHQVLVGMDRRMVTESLGRAPRKIREKDEAGGEYEEWIYGTPPEDVQFVRFVGDEVVLLKIMKVDGEKIVRTQKEIDLSEVAAAEAAPKPAEQPGPLNRPTLKRAGEEPDSDSPANTGRPPEKVLRLPKVPAGSTPPPSAPGEPPPPHVE